MKFLFFAIMIPFFGRTRLAALAIVSVLGLNVIMLYVRNLYDVYSRILHRKIVHVSYCSEQRKNESNNATSSSEEK